MGFPRVSLRYILTEALIRLGTKGDSPEGMEKLLIRLAVVLYGLENGKTHIPSERGELNSTLPNSFIESVMRPAKQGVNTG